MMNREELIKYFNFDDVIHKDPNYDPYVILAGYESWRPSGYERIPIYGEPTRYGSCMIPVESKQRALDEIDYSLMPTFSGGYFEDFSGKSKYITNESFEHNKGLIVEPLYVDRYWSGLGLHIYEPSQRLTLYLELLNKGNEWIDPYNNEVVIRIIKKEELDRDIKHTLHKIEIKIDYLKDYLAAREAGLLIAKHSSRCIVFESPDQIPLENGDKDIRNGKWSFFSSDHPALAKGEILAEAEIRQKFWIKPLPEPRSEYAKSRGEFVGGVEFILNDGSRKEYDVEAGHKGDYFKLLSFNPRVMDIFLGRPNFDYEEYTRETLELKFPNGETLHVAVNLSGQIQVWWGGLAKLSKKYQELLAPYSEPWLEKLSENHEYWRITIQGRFPQTTSLKKTLQELKSEINQYFLSKFNETFFNQKSSVEDLKRVHELYVADSYQLLDTMEQLDKWLFSEERPNKIIEYYSLSDEMDNKEDLAKIKSLVSLKLLLKKYFGKEESENRTLVLSKVKALRNCKAHYKDLLKTLKEFKLEDKSPREIYKKLIAELEDFLEWLYELCRGDAFV